MLCFNNSHEFHQTVLFHRRGDRELRGGKRVGGESARQPAGVDRLWTRFARELDRYPSLVSERPTRRLGDV
jgi:hypothetical protein